MNETDIIMKVQELREQFLSIAESVHDDVESAAQFFDTYFVKSVLSPYPLFDNEYDNPDASKSRPSKQAKNPLDSSINNPTKDNEETLIQLINEMDAEELRFLHKQLLLELEWIDQAIVSRRKFLCSLCK